MKIKYFFSAAVCAAMAFIFFACSSDDSGGAAGGSNFADLPKQVYIWEYDDNGDLIVQREEYKGNGDIELHFGDEDKYDVIPAGKIQNGQISLNLPIIDSEDLNKWESCDDTNCQISVVPKNLSVIGGLSSFDVNIPNKSNCNNLRLHLIKSDKGDRVRFFYFSESGKITGTETETYDYGGEYKYTYDMNFSKGWNLVVIYSDGNGNSYVTTDLSDGELEWSLLCRDD
ncbi:MAG: hypothetical protein FWH22_06410 [Fibromonadales bacterium]|nr:hypothetical protein [Fibromonadales bacterium]